MASAGPNIVVADARSTWRPRCVTSATTAIVSLVLAIVVVLLGFVVPAPAAAADSQLASPNAGTCGAARCFQLDGGGLSSKVAGSAFVVESCVYDSTATRAGDDVRVFLTSDGEVSATRAAPGEQLALPGARQVEAQWGANTYGKGGLMTGPEHINYRHGFDSGFSNVSKFSEGTSLRQIDSLVDDALRYGEVSQGGASIVRNTGRVIGIDQAGNPVTGLQVWVRDGVIQSAYPVAVP